MPSLDEVIAQVNNDVIVLSRLRREMSDRVAALEDSGVAEPQATERVAKERGAVVTMLISEQLLLQRGKELGLAEDVESEVRRRMLQVAQAQGLPSVEALQQGMRQQGLSLEVIQRSVRSGLMAEAVLQREVDWKLHAGFSVAEVKAYVDAHPERFPKPQPVPPAGSSPSFDEARVREAMVLERRPGAREAYLQSLRTGAFIRITESDRDGAR